MEDHARYVKYHKYQGLEAGHASVVGGEVVPGQVVAVHNEQEHAILSGHPEWSSATERQFEKQPTDNQEDSSNA